MTRPYRSWLFLLVMVAFAAGCEVTAEKIELWKGTQNGPKKLAASIIDPELDMSLRVQATVALVEINSWDLFRDAFQKMEPAEASKVVSAVAPVFAEKVKSDPNEKSLTRIQVDAKDALFWLLDYAEGEGKKAAEAALIEWSTVDYNERAMAGQYRIKTIIKKIGPAAAEAIIPLLSTKQLVIKHVAELLREVDDEAVLAKASKALADDLLAAPPETLRELHLVSAAIIGGESVGSALLQLSTDKKVDPKLQRFGLRAFSEAVSKHSIELNDDHINALFKMAENDEYDPYQREETYYVIAQGKREQDIPRIMKLLGHKEEFWRAVGIRCILRMDGEKQLEPLLLAMDREGLSARKGDVGEAVERIASFPTLLPKVRELLRSKSTFSRAVAIEVLAKIGEEGDAQTLNTLKGDKGRLPKGFGKKSIGDAAAAAAEAIQQRG